MQKKTKKFDEKQLEEQVIALLAEIDGDKAGETSPLITKDERITALAAILLYRSSKKLEMYSKALLVTTVILAASLVSLTAVLVYIIVQFLLPLIG